RWTLQRTHRLAGFGGTVGAMRPPELGARARAIETEPRVGGSHTIGRDRCIAADGARKRRDHTGANAHDESGDAMQSQAMVSRESRRERSRRRRLTANRVQDRSWRESGCTPGPDDEVGGAFQVDQWRRAGRVAEKNEVTPDHHGVERVESWTLRGNENARPDDHGRQVLLPHRPEDVPLREQLGT